MAIEQRQEAEDILGALLLLQLNSWAREDFALFYWAERAERELREVLTRTPWST